MKATPNLLAEKFRVREGQLGSSRFDGNNGAFIVPLGPIPAHGHITYACCIVSDGGGWEHVSVSVGERHRGEFRGLPRCPTWEEMDRVKRLFWNDDETVVQLHVPRSEHVSDHNYTLHLWRPIHDTIPLPPSVMVGIGVGPEKLATMTPQEIEAKASELAAAQGVRK